MGHLLGLAQCGQPADGDVIAQVDAWAARARREGVDLLAFPENLMCPRELDAAGLRNLAEPLDGPFLQALGAIANRYGLWLAGTLYEKNPVGGQPYNTAFVLDGEGALQGSYRKCHLYDAHGVRESDRMSAGEALATPIHTPFGTIGLAICYDLRFPEVARASAVAGCDLLLYPAAWHDGPHKAAHWKTLLAARAIENECFVAGICRAGGRYVGHSMVVGPLGEVLVAGPAGADGPAGEALVTAEVDLAAVAEARANMPVLAHRRPELYRP